MPSTQALFALWMRISSWCSWMSSHTQPQKVQVALSMTCRASWHFLDRIRAAAFSSRCGYLCLFSDIGRHPNRTTER